MPRTCPRCSAALTACTFGATAVDGCSTCGGLWLDSQELNKLTRDPSTGLMEVERAFASVMYSPGSGDMHCPQCAQPLREFSFPHTPNVKLDACPGCKGIWADDGELGAIAQRVAEHRPATTSATPADTVRLQARTLTGFLLSSPCHKCKTSNPASSIVCWACGASLKAREIYHLCPRCNHPLEERSCGAASGTKVDVCLLCTGVWMEAGEVSAFCQLGFEAVNDIQSVLSRHQTHPKGNRADCMARCPACHSEMVSQTYGSRRTVQADRCSNCRSLWLDAGELLTVVELVQSGDFTLESARSSDAWADAQ
jgi:Zn-finger nucleic acid-binding protein